jgi:cytochrome c
MKKSAFRGVIALGVFYTMSVSALAIAQGNVSEGKKIYEQECVSCHLANGAGSGIYPALKALSQEEALKRLKGYRDGTYGGSMKSVMESFSKGKSDKQLEDLAAYIATLKK